MATLNLAARLTAADVVRAQLWHWHAQAQRVRSQVGNARAILALSAQSPRHDEARLELARAAENLDQLTAAIQHSACPREARPAD